MSPKKRKKWPWILGLALLLVAGVYVGFAALVAQRVPHGVKVEGVDISGMTEKEATAQLQKTVAKTANRQITLKVADKTERIDPRSAGLTFSASRTAKKAVGFTLNPVKLWSHISGAGSIRPVTTIDKKRLTRAVTSVADKTQIVGVDGGITLDGTTATPVEPKLGERIDITAAADSISKMWINRDRTLTLKRREIQPTINAKEIDRAMTEVAKPLLSAPVTATAGDWNAEIPVEALTQIIAIQAKDGKLQPVVDEKMLDTSINKRIKNLVWNLPRNPRFTYANHQITGIVDGSAGQNIDFKAYSPVFLKAALSQTDRTAAADLVEMQPTLTREQLEGLRGQMTVKISEFATPYDPSGERDTNLQIGADRITGWVIMPGETFSMNHATGKRTAENGWAPGGIIGNGGKFEVAYGGGLSQVSTTLYNATHLAGMEDVEHQPHTEWISRYPKGREATIYDEIIDNRFKNNTPNPVVVEGWLQDNQVHVAMWSTAQYWTVTSTISEPYDFTPARVFHESGPGCQAMTGTGGFSVDITRTRDHGDEHHVDTWFWAYWGEPTYICDDKEPKP